MEQLSENRRLFVRKYQFAWGNVRKRSSNRHDQAPHARVQHNQVLERTYVLEQDMTVAKHDIESLKGKVG